MLKNTKKFIWIAPFLFLVVFLFPKNSWASVSNITHGSATLDGTVTGIFACAQTDGCFPPFSFTYGTSASNLDQTINGIINVSFNGGDTETLFSFPVSSNISGLLPNTTYYYSLNNIPQGSFTTLTPPPSVTLVPNPTSVSIGSPIPSWPGNRASYDFTVSCPSSSLNANTVVNFYPVASTLPPGTVGWEFYDFPYGNPPYGPYGLGVLNCVGGTGRPTLASFYVWLGPNVAVGTYNIILAGSSNDGSPVSNLPLTLQLVVTPPASFNLTCTNSCGFTGAVGGTNPANQTLSISNTGGSSLAWTASKIQSWLTISPTSGTASSNGSSNITVSTNTNGLSAGTYTDTISVVSGGTTKTIPVSLIVTSGSSSVTIVSSTWKIYSKPSSAQLAFDYDSDGFLTDADTIILLKVVTNLMPCPVGKNCDVNNNGSLSTTDLNAFTGIVTALRLANSTLAGKANFPSTVFPDGNYRVTLETLDSINLTSIAQKSFTVGSSGAIDGVGGTSCGKTYSSGTSSWGSDTFCSTGTASPTSPGFPAQGSSVSWVCQGQNGGNSPSCTATRSSPAGTYSVTINRTVGGTVKSSESSPINCGNVCVKNYSQGTSVLLQAIPDSNWKFVGWSGDCSANVGCSVLVNGPKLVWATFIPSPFQYTEF